MTSQRQFILGLVILFVSGGTRSDTTEESEAVKFLESLEPKYSDACYKQTETRWTYTTNVNNETEHNSVEASNEFAEFQASVQKEILARFPNWKSFQNESVRREFQFLSILGPGNLTSEEIAMLNEIQAKMESAYAKATVCEYKNPTRCNLSLDPEIQDKLVKSKDYDELAYYWTAWHDKMGSDVTSAQYSEFIGLQNKMAKANGFEDMSQLMLEQYNDGEPGWSTLKFKTEMETIWKSLEPYYRKLHAYVGLQLKKNPNYTAQFTEHGFGEVLPAHLFGNMWAQEWGELDGTTKPFPNASALDTTSALVKKGYTSKKIFEVADEFFGGMGLQRMTAKFWENSMLVKPEDGRSVVCHASAEDLCTGKGNTDFRIKMCTQVTSDDLVTAHHEMGHIEYFMQYTNQHFIFRNGANPGFHEALGDALALAVTTPKHLQCILELDLGLDLECNQEESTPGPTPLPTPTDINFLYLMALDKIAFLPFAYSVDKWRWEVFEGKLKPEEYTSRWWEIRKENQGIVPPSPRSSSSFDPAAKYHIVANVEYIRYFISHILQFQFYEAMCITAQEFTPGSPTSKPLYQCDFAGNQEAGAKLAKMMAVGFSKPWPEALKILTGGRGLSTSSLINYFTPLFTELDKRLAEAGIAVRSTFRTNVSKNY